MDTEILEIFVEAVRRGSFAAVARDRGVDPSSISRAIATLESDLGVRLLQRSTRRLAPTEAGMIYFERVESIVEELGRARALAADAGKRPTGRLRVAAPVSFTQLNIVDLLPEFAAAYPDLSLDLVLTDATVDLVTERIDVALRMGPLADSLLVAHRLAPLVMCACASPAYLERRGRPARPSDLAGHDCLVLAMPGFGPRWRFRADDGSIEEVTVSARVTTSNDVALKRFALAGMGVCLQSRWTDGQELRTGELVDLFPQLEATVSSFDNAMWVIYPSRAYLPLKVWAFVDFLKDKFRNGPPGDTESAT
ncbi:MAG: LysR family transcriptional regulator [Alphaproteobacteria bacterium]|nr:LysR family transcriptional regulator [Alphaproteobacteria bacterium]